jgi:hypothetical protein
MVVPLMTVATGAALEEELLGFSEAVLLLLPRRHCQYLHSRQRQGCVEARLGGGDLHFGRQAGRHATPKGV